jgi:Tol biopolymer transport system component
VLFNELGEGAGNLAARSYLRKVDGSSPVQLGDSFAKAFSPDGKFALTHAEPVGPSLTLLPLGAGSARKLDLQGLIPDWAAFLPSGKGIVFRGVNAQGRSRLYAQDLLGGPPRPVTGEIKGGGWTLPTSPDGGAVIDTDSEGRWAVFPLDGSPARLLPGIDPADGVVQWSQDGRFLFVKTRGEVPLRVYRYEIATGHHELWKELRPTDVAGVVDYGSTWIARDGRAYAYSYDWVQSSDLYVVDGLH